MGGKPRRNDAVSVIVFSVPRHEGDVHEVIVMRVAVAEAVQSFHDRFPGGCTRGGEHEYRDAAVRHLIRKTGMNTNPGSLILLAHECKTARNGRHVFFACFGNYKLPARNHHFLKGDRVPVWVPVLDLIKPEGSLRFDHDHRAALKEAWELHRPAPKRPFLPQQRNHFKAMATGR